MAVGAPKGTPPGHTDEKGLGNNSEAGPQPGDKGNGQGNGKNDSSDGGRGHGNVQANGHEGEKANGKGQANSRADEHGNGRDPGHGRGPIWCDGEEDTAPGNSELAKKATAHKKLKLQTETTSFLYDGLGLNVLKEYKGTSAPKAEYYFANGQVLGRKMFGAKDSILPEREPGLANGGTYYYLTDGLGSVTDLVDHNGQVAKQYRYDAFGGLFTGTVGLYNTIGLTGKSYDPRAGLMDYGARWYDPQVWRFTQVDPFPGFLDWSMSQHGYSYVENDPVNNTDPTGMLTCGHPTDECTGFELRPGPSSRVLVITRTEPDVGGYWEYGFWQVITRTELWTFWRDGSSRLEAVIEWPYYDGPYENFVPETGGGGEGPPPPPPPPSNDEIRDESNRQMRESGGEAPVTKVYAPGVWEELQKGLQTNWEGYTLGHSGALNVTYTGGTDYPTHPLVTKAKEMLRDLSGFPHVIDNEYGKFTAGYVEQFQKQYGLLDVPGIKAGVLDEATYDALKRVHQAHLASRAQAGASGAAQTCDDSGNCLSSGQDNSDGLLTQDTHKGSAWQPWTQNLYVYVYNNPVNLTDPTGHCPECDDAGDAGGGLGYDRTIMAQLSHNEAAEYHNCLEAERFMGGSEHIGVGCKAKWPGRFGEGTGITDAAMSATVDVLLALGPFVLIQGMKWVFQNAPYHHQNSKGGQNGGKAHAPTNPLVALQNSVQIKGTSPRRIGVDPKTGEIVIFDRTRIHNEGTADAVSEAHGHVRSWDSLSDVEKNALVNAGLVDRKGRILVK